MISASAAKMKTQESIFHKQNPNYGYNCLSDSIEEATRIGAFSTVFVETTQCSLPDDTCEVERLLMKQGYDVQVIGSRYDIGKRTFVVSWAEAE